MAADLTVEGNLYVVGEIRAADGSLSVAADVTGDVTGEVTAANFATDATGVGFFTEAGTPVAQQNVPLTTPTVQQVIDALVALGLVEQSDA